MIGNMDFKSGNSSVETSDDYETLEQDSEFRLEQIRKDITESLDRVAAIKNIKGAEFEKKEIWRTLGSLTKQLRVLEEKLGIQQDYSISEE